MTFDENAITIKPGYQARTWQSCDWFTADGRELFHHRTGMRTAPKPDHRHPLARALWLCGGDEWESCWMPGEGTRAEIEALAAKHGGKAIACFYAPEGADSFFLSFASTETALAFCRAEDFDRLCLSVEKQA